MIPLPEKTKIKKEEENKADFIISGLYPGYGTTIGNSLRRVLLSSIEGAAITKVRMKDVDHEFSTMSGVREDAVNILLNLKGVHFRKFTEEPITAELKVSGEKEVTAADFDIPSQLEIVNGDHHIATLTDKKASLEMEVEVTHGVGYEPAEKRESGAEIGSLNLDAVYNPVSKVSFKVEAMRVGERTDFDRLTLHVETDGRIGPEKAFKNAVEILKEHFSSIEIKPEEEKPETKEEEEEEAEDKEETEEEVDPSDVEVDKLDLTNRVKSILKENRIKTLAGLAARSEENIGEMEGIGPKSLENIKKALKKRDLSLK